MLAGRSSRYEIGAVITKSGHIDRIVYGKKDNVVIFYDNTTDIGTFHTHIDPVDDMFSISDIHDYITTKEEVMALGVNGCLGYFKTSWLPKKLKDTIINYNNLSGSDKRKLSRKLYDYITKHTKWIEG